MRGLEFVFEIIPEVIPVVSQDFTVKEGGSKVLDAEIIKVTNKYFQTDALDYMVIKEPVTGSLENTRKPGKPIIQFNQVREIYAILW